MRKAIAVNPEDAKSYCNLAAFYAYAKRYDKALQTVDKGLELAPGDSCLTSRKDQLGVVLADRAEATGDWAAAIALYEKAAASTPGDLSTAQRLGELYFKQGRSLAAKADSLPEGPEKQAALEQVKQAFSRSAESFGKYSAGHPDKKDGRYNYMIALIQADKYEDAGRATIATLAVDPLNPEFHSALSSAYRGLKNWRSPPTDTRCWPACCAMGTRRPIRPTSPPSRRPSGAPPRTRPSCSRPWARPTRCALRP